MYRVTETEYMPLPATARFTASQDRSHCWSLHSSRETGPTHLLPYSTLPVLRKDLIQVELWHTLTDIELFGRISQVVPRSEHQNFIDTHYIPKQNKKRPCVCFLRQAESSTLVHAIALVLRKWRQKDRNSNSPLTSRERPHQVTRDCLK